MLTAKSFLIIPLALIALADLRGATGKNKSVATAPAVTDKGKSATPEKSPVPLAKAIVVFRTNDGGKLPETGVSVYILRKDGFAAAMKRSISWNFENGKDYSFTLDRFTGSRSDIAKLRIGIQTNARFIWRFDCTLYLEWQDKTVTPIAFDNLTLSDRNSVFEGNLASN